MRHWPLHVAPLIAMTALVAPMPAHAGDDRAFEVLVFSRTTGFRHESIAAGQTLIQTLGDAHGFAVTLTEDPASFTPKGLAGFAVVVFLNTTGSVLDSAGKAAFEAWLRAGGGYVGVHSAADTEYDWPFYGELIGGHAWFHSHPAIQTARIDVERGDDPAVRHLPAHVDIEDEWYNFRANPRPVVDVLLRLDEQSYAPGDGAMGVDHPIAWKRTIDAGRSFYTGLGHRIETYLDPRFRRHMLGGLVWAAGDGVLSAGFEPTRPAMR